MPGLRAASADSCCYSVSQARFPVEPFLRYPGVDRLAEFRAHILVEQRIAAVDDVAHGHAETEMVEQIGLHVSQPATGYGGMQPFRRPPVLPAGERRARRVGHVREGGTVDIARCDLVLPIIAHVGHQGADIGHVDVHVTIYCTGQGQFHQSLPGLPPTISIMIAGMRSTPKSPRNSASCGHVRDRTSLG